MSTTVKVRQTSSNMSVRNDAVIVELIDGRPVVHIRCKDEARNEARLRELARRILEVLYE